MSSFCCACCVTLKRAYERPVKKVRSVPYSVCILQSAPEDEGEQKVTIPKNVNKCSLVFAYPEVFVDEKNVAKILKRKEFNMKVQAIVVDEAPLVQQW